MVYIEIRCIVCKSDNIKKYGKQSNGVQRYRCDNKKCSRKTFILQYQQRGKDLEIKKQVIDMAMNGSGMRDTARVLRISRNTVASELKKNRTV